MDRRSNDSLLRLALGAHSSYADVEDLNGAAAHIARGLLTLLTLCRQHQREERRHQCQRIQVIPAASPRGRRLLIIHPRSGRRRVQSGLSTKPASTPKVINRREGQEEEQTQQGLGA